MNVDAYFVSKAIVIWRHQTLGNGCSAVSTTLTYSENTIVLIVVYAKDKISVTLQWPYLN